MTPNSVGRATGTSPAPQPIRANTFGTGILSGTVILTLDGEMPVEFVAPGDRIITRDAGMVRLDEVSRITRRLRAISFAAGSLGHTRPDQDLILPAAQPVLIRDWRAEAMFGRKQAVVQAGALVDGEFIRDLGVQDMVLHQLHFSAPHVIYGGGLELVSGGVDALDMIRAA